MVIFPESLPKLSFLKTVIFYKYSHSVFVLLDISESK